MGRILSITDDALGASATVHIRDTDGAPRTVEVTFSALDGGDLTADVLAALLAGVGVALPVPTVAAAAARIAVAPSTATPAKKAAAKKAAPKKAPAKKAAARKATTAGKATATAAATRSAPPQRRYRTGPPPTPTELQSAFRDSHGDIHAMAEQFNAGVSTVSLWLRKAREAGTVISLNGAEPATADV